MGPTVQPSRDSVDEAKLRRDLGVTLAVAVTINAMVGTGIFRLSPKVLRLVGSSDAALGVWLAGGIISLCGALCLAELAASLPRAGGIYEFLRRAYGPTIAFTFGWTRLTLLGPSAAGSFARLASESFAATFGLQPHALRETGVAVAVLVLCTLANLSGVRAASMGQALLTAVKLGGLLLLGFACITMVAPSSEVAVTQMAAPSSAVAFTMTGAFAALVSVMWTFDGWGDMSSLAGEARDPARTLPRAFILGTLVVTLAYVLVNIGYVRALGEPGVVASTSGADMVSMNAARAALGESGARLLAGLVFVSCVGACMVGVLTGSRVFVAMASDGLFIRWLGHVTSRGTPSRAVVLTSCLGIAYLSVRSFEQLTDSFVAGMFPFYMLATLAIPILRHREPELPRPFRVPLYPLVPLLFLIGASALLVGALQDVEGIAYWAFGVMLLGVPVGFIWSRRRNVTSP